MSSSPSHVTHHASPFNNIQTLKRLSMNRYLPKPKLSISGPGGIQATFDWQAAKNAAAGRMFTVELTNARWVDVLGFGDVRDRGVGAIEQLAVPAVAARDEFDHSVSYVAMKRSGFGRRCRARGRWTRRYRTRRCRPRETRASSSRHRQRAIPAKVRCSLRS